MFFFPGVKKPYSYGFFKPIYKFYKVQVRVHLVQICPFFSGPFRVEVTNLIWIQVRIVAKQSFTCPKGMLWNPGEIRELQRPGYNGQPWIQQVWEILAPSPLSPLFKGHLESPIFIDPAWMVPFVAESFRNCLLGTNLQPWWKLLRLTSITL